MPVHIGFATKIESRFPIKLLRRYVFFRNCNMDCGYALPLKLPDNTFNQINGQAPVLLIRLDNNSRELAGVFFERLAAEMIHLIFRNNGDRPDHLMIFLQHVERACHKIACDFRFSRIRLIPSAKGRSNHGFIQRHDRFRFALLSFSEQHVTNHFSL